MQAAVVATLWLHYGACILLFGAALFRRLVPPETADTAADVRLGRWLTGCAALALTGAVLLLLAETASIAGGWAATADPHMIGTVLTKTGFGVTWLGRLILIVFALAVSRRGPAKVPGAAEVGAALIASLAFSGHPAAIGGRWLEPNQAVHLLAAGAWLGALVPLAVRLMALRGDRAAAERCLRRFSNYGTVAVVLILATGIANTIVLGAPLARLLTTPYGQVLLAKLMLVAAMIALASVNRVRLVPALARSADDRIARLLQRAVLAEIALGAVVVLVACGLGTLPPPGG